MACIAGDTSERKRHLDTFATFIDHCAAVEPGAEVIAYAPQDEVTGRMTWRELREGSREAAKKLIALGVEKGSRVGFLCSNRHEWLPFAFGALRIGAVLVPFSTLWKEAEIAYALDHADVDWLITLASFRRHDYIARIRDARTRAPRLREVLVLGESGGPFRAWEKVASFVSDESLDAVEAQVAPGDIATIFFTSGTTAQAKAVVHTHRAILASAQAIAPRLGITREDLWWGHMPLFWTGGFVLGALSTLAGGGRILLHENVDPATALSLLEREGCTIMAGWHQGGPLLEQPGFDHRRIKLRKGSYHPLAEHLMGPDHYAVGMYGMTETATVLTCARWDEPKDLRTTTAGRPVEGALVKIVDPESGEPLAPGETGEICVKGPSLMEGYHRVPRENTFDADGFFKTGDRGFVDANGYLHFLGRLKDVIKTAGVNVAASEVEETLQRHPAVKAAYVVGVAHPVRGENVAAFVVLHPESTAQPVELQEFCKQNLASYKVPRHVLLIDEASVPRTGTGKVEKTALRREAEARIGSCS